MFSLNIPTKVYFGRKCFAVALEEEKVFLQNKRVLLVTTGRSLYRLGYIDAIVEELRKYAAKICIFDHISANPRLTEVKEGIEAGKGEEVDLIAGFGGGSALDAAKAIAAGIGCSESVDEMLFNGSQPSEKALPIIAIPTTSGTGSELSKAAILSDKEKRIKSGIRGENIFPKLAIVDSYFTEQIPVATTLETGFDVFAHAVESFVSVKANCFSEDLSLRSIDIVSKCLPALKQEPSHSGYREEMSYASMIMGINLGNVGTALPHRLQYPVGVASDTSHAAGLLALYPAWIETEWDYSAEKLRRISRIIQKNTDLHCDEHSMVTAFIEKLGVRKNLTELCGHGVDTGQLAAEVTGNLINDPAYQGMDTLLKIYEKSL